MAARGSIAMAGIGESTLYPRSQHAFRVDAKKMVRGEWGRHKFVSSPSPMARQAGLEGPYAVAVVKLSEGSALDDADRKLPA